MPYLCANAPASLARAVVLPAAILAGSLASPVAAQSVYKCPGPGGQTIFQQAPCAQGGERVAVRQGNVLDSQATVNPQLLESAQRRSLVQRGQLFDGMSGPEVRQVLGQPLAINRRESRAGTQEQ